MGKRRVLVVDDNQDLAMSCSWLLKIKGMRSRSPSTASRPWKSPGPSDPMWPCSMSACPDIDGYELARRLRAEFGPDVLLIIITAYARDNPRRRRLTRPTSTTTS